MRTKSPATREAIIGATTRLMAQREFAAIGTGEIARAAGVAEGTIFRYFPSKADIYRTIINEKGAQFHTELARQLAEVRDPAQKLVLVTKKHLQFAATHRELLNVILRAETFNSGPADAECFSMLRKVLASFEAAVREGLRRRVLRAGLDVRACALALRGVILAVLTEDRLDAGGQSSEAELLARSDAHLDIVLRGMIKPAPRRTR